MFSFCSSHSALLSGGSGGGGGAVSSEFLRNKSMSERKRLPAEVFAVVILFGTPAGEPRWENAISLMAFALPSTYSTFFTAEDFLMSLALSALDFIERDSFRLSPPDKLNLLVVRFLTSCHRYWFSKNNPPALTCGTWRRSVMESARARAAFPVFLLKIHVNHAENWVLRVKSLYCGKIVFKFHLVYGWNIDTIQIKRPFCVRFFLT